MLSSRRAPLPGHDHGDAALIARLRTVVLKQDIKRTANRALNRGIEPCLIAALQTAERVMGIGVSLPNDIIR
jgi:hypothetical protein